MVTGVQANEHKIIGSFYYNSNDEYKPIYMDKSHIASGVDSVLQTLEDKAGFKIGIFANNKQLGKCLHVYVYAYICMNQ